VFVSQLMLKQLTRACVRFAVDVGMCIKIHIIKNRIKMYQSPCVKFIPQTLTSNLKAEFTVLATQWRTLGGLARGSEPPPPQ
jgi:hypothetical protein